MVQIYAVILFLGNPFVATDYGLENTSVSICFGSAIHYHLENHFRCILCVGLPSNKRGVLKYRNQSNQNPLSSGNSYIINLFLSKVFTSFRWLRRQNNHFVGYKLTKFNRSKVRLAMELNLCLFICLRTHART